MHWHLQLPEPAAQGGVHPLGHCRGVASWGIGHLDATLAAIVEVDVVGANGGGANETHPAALEQAGIAARAGAHQQRTGIAHRSRSDVARVEILDTGKGLKQPLDVGNVAFYNDFYHDQEIMCATYMAQAPAMSSNTGM